MNEWQPIETAPVDEYILLSFANMTLPDIGRYEVDENGDGVFYSGDDDEGCLKKYGLIVDGWMKLPRCNHDLES